MNHHIHPRTIQPVPNLTSSQGEQAKADPHVSKFFVIVPGRQASDSILSGLKRAKGKRHRMESSVLMPRDHDTAVIKACRGPVSSPSVPRNCKPVIIKVSGLQPKQKGKLEPSLVIICRAEKHNLFSRSFSGSLVIKTVPCIQTNARLFFIQSLVAQY
ncbi:uncharacterized protein LY79DRAFT_548091 [Colletotrichum navitas]|uniref:Uncharacterized protein n=1 Tax=Colletotrichum navitas TaxID=681940 RepID=A0AAD8Q374_9PEZI|nr:uncharacterized protein LY79DRAFT_548091 [Colletotrichum navitas]KAK1595102.1 hypothetical protein LY79DRAFT_548091 [Colletotrichum navitas]